MAREAMGSAVSPIRTYAEGTCHVCGGRGEIAYSGLRDRLFGVAGEWTLRRCPDRDCGLLWLDPMPIEEDLPRLYENYYTHENAVPGKLRQAMKQSYWITRYGDGREVDLRTKMLAVLVRLIPGLRVQLDLAVFELPVKCGGRLLEIGCGNGSTLRQLAGLGWEVHGVDFDRAAVELARSCGLPVRLGSLEAQAYPPGMFDAVVMSHVLEHVPEPRGFLAECRRVLRPGGTLVSITPNASSWGHRRFRYDWLHLDPPRHLHIFAPAALRNLARAAGFPCAAVKSSVGNSGGMMLASRKLQRYGHYEMVAQLAPSCEMAVRLFQLIAAVQHFFSPDDSDELVLHAVKAN